jgi:tubulin-specific chaperone A
VAYYEKEVKENENKLQGMKENKKDAYDIKKFEEVLGESYMMIPDSKARFQTSLEELSLFIDGNPGLQGEWISAAKSVLEEHGNSTNTPASETNVDDLTEGEAF